MEIRSKRAVQVEKVTEVLCNKCKRSLINLLGFEGTSFSVEFGYGSKRDGTKEKFDLCDECYEDLINSFHYPPEKVPYVW